MYVKRAPSYGYWCLTTGKRIMELEEEAIVAAEVERETWKS